MNVATFDTVTTLTSLKNKQRVKATGDPWDTNGSDHTVTVPVPTPVIMVKVDGPFRERERKLWTFLLHAVIEDIYDKKIHKLPATEIWKVFNRLGGENGKRWLWDALEALSEAKVTFEGVDEDDERFKGVTRLISGTKVSEGNGQEYVYFEFPQMLIEAVVEPLRYARIRTHFVLKLSGKYSVSLYEVLESIANKQEPTIEATVDELRQWLKVPEGKLPLWGNLFARAIKPAIDEINSDPDGCGFHIDYEVIRAGRNKVTGMKFRVEKTTARIEFENALRSQAGQGKRMSNTFLPVVYEKAKKAAPGFDVYALELEWREWMESKDDKPDNEEAAFIGFCKQKVRNVVSIGGRTLAG